MTDENSNSSSKEETSAEEQNGTTLKRGERIKTTDICWDLEDLVVDVSDLNENKCNNNEEEKEEKGKEEKKVEEKEKKQKKRKKKQKTKDVKEEKEEKEEEKEEEKLPISKRDNIINEIRITEQDYVKDLKIIVDVFITPLKENNILQIKQISGIFSNVAVILNINEKLNDDLLSNPDNNSILIGEIFLGMVR